jgi:hypothetical protein
MVSAFMRVLLLAFAALTLTACCDYSTPSTLITSTGQQLCSHHHIPLVTVDGFKYAGAPLPPIEPTGEFDRVMRCNPNGIGLYESLKCPNRYYWKHAKVTYCPKCEEAIQQWCKAHPNASD